MILKATNIKPLFVTAFTDRSYVMEGFNAGARGYVDEDVAAGDLLRAIQVVSQGGTFLSQSICNELLEPHVSGGESSEYDFNLRCLVASGFKEEEIAERLHQNQARIRADARSVPGLFGH